MNETEHLGPLFKTIGTAADNSISRQLQKTGLTSAQMFILHYLSHHTDGEIYQKDIEEALELSHATVAGIISRLENKDFVRLVPSKKDKRCKQIAATEKAKELDAETGRVIREAEQRLLTGFSEEETEQLKGYLKRILFNLGIEMPKRKIPKEDSL